MRLFQELKPYYLSDSGETDIFTVLLLVAAAISSLIPAFLHRVFFDRVIPDRSVEMILPIMILIVAVEAVGISARYLAERQLISESRRNRHRLRSRLTRRLWNLKLGWFEQHGSGAALRHFDDAGLLGNIRAVFIRDLIGPLIILVLLLPSMLLLQPLLTVSRMAVSLPAFLAGSRFLKHDLRYERKLWLIRKHLNGGLVEGVRGVSTLKSGRGGDGYACHLRGAIAQLGRLEEKRRILGAGWEASAAAISRIGNAMILMYAVFLVVEGRLSFGSYIAFSILSSRFLSALGELLGGIRTVAQTGNAAERQRGFYNQRHDSDLNFESLLRFSPKNRGLEINGLSFGYPGAGTVLRDLKLDVIKDERVLLFGGSGEGKSTLFSLILGLYTPQKGDIRYSGVSLLECPASVRREIVGAALQKPTFFNGTIRENLCLYGPAPSDRYLWNVLESAAADELVARLPGGLDARLYGEDSGLSGGQKQRLAIARLIVHPPPLMLLDEPMSSLDAESRKRVCVSLSKACEGRTAIFISHGEIPAMSFDRKLNLAGGRIVSAGPGGLHGR